MNNEKIPIRNQPGAHNVLLYDYEKTELSVLILLPDLFITQPSYFPVVKI